MEKHIETGRTLAAASEISAPTIFQLENGAEECQIKRIVLSGVTQDAGDSEANALKLGLFQESPSISDLSLQDAVIYSIITTNNAVALINETTTVRVPRGWYLAVWAESPISQGTGDAFQVFFNCQLNYKVLS